MTNRGMMAMVNSNIRDINPEKRKAKEYNDIFMDMIDIADKEKFKRKGIFTISFELHTQ